MAAGDTPITVVGNLVADPELRFTPSGQPVATFRIASTPRIRDNATNEWKDGDRPLSLLQRVAAGRPRTSPSRCSAACGSS